MEKTVMNNLIDVLSKYLQLDGCGGGYGKELLISENATVVMGYSDDLIEFDGLTHGEFPCFDKTRRFEFEDGTKISIKYEDTGIWRIKITKTGSSDMCFSHCESEDDSVYSDVLIIRSRKKGKQDE